jgi:hypothetical protein
MSATLDTACPDISRPGFEDHSETDEWATIEVRHEANLFGVYRTFEITIDGHRAGSAGRKTPCRCRITPGWHTLTARMDWVQTQTVSVYANGNERVIFRCGMGSFHSRVWTVAMISLAVMLAVTGIMTGLMWAFPGLKAVESILFGFFMAPPLMVLLVCELIVFGRMMPWSRPGQVFRLIRHDVEPELPDSR